MLSHLQTEVGVEVEAELGNISIHGPNTVKRLVNQGQKVAIGRGTQQIMTVANTFRANVLE